MARKTELLQGTWMADGFIASRNPLLVEVSMMGHLYDPDSGDELTVRREKVSRDAYTVEVSNGCWVFEPCEGELERVGAVVEN